MLLADQAGNIIVWVVWVGAAIALLGSALAVVLFQNPFYSALALIVNLGSLAVLYLIVQAEFVAAAQVLVYAGAVIVLFLFVIAYLGGRADAPWAGSGRGQVHRDRHCCHGDHHRGHRRGSDRSRRGTRQLA